MIFVVTEKRLNDFKLVCCVKPRDLYSRYGKRLPNNSDFESSNEVVPMNMSKLEQIEYIQRYDNEMAELERQNQTVNDSSSEPHGEKRNEVSEES